MTSRKPPISLDALSALTGERWAVEDARRELRESVSIERKTSRARRRPRGKSRGLGDDR